MQENCENWPGLENSCVYYASGFPQGLEKLKKLNFLEKS